VCVGVVHSGCTPALALAAHQQARPAPTPQHAHTTLTWPGSA
jgi:hypothetical protein